MLRIYNTLNPPRPHTRRLQPKMGFVFPQAREGDLEARMIAADRTLRRSTQRSLLQNTCCTWANKTSVQFSNSLHTKLFKSLQLTHLDNTNYTYLSNNSSTIRRRLSSGVKLKHVVKTPEVRSNGEAQHRKFISKSKPRRAKYCQQGKHTQRPSCSVIQPDPTLPPPESSVAQSLWAFISHNWNIYNLTLETLTPSLPTAYGKP